VFKEVHPVLPSRNVASAIEFYVKKLGFDLKLQDADDPTYAVVRRDDVELHLQWHDPTEWDRVERPLLRMVVTDVDGLYAELEHQGVFHKHTTLRDTPWGTREFAFFDLDQNGLTFCRDLPSP